MYIIPKNFGSNQGLVSGCAGCVGGNVANWFTDVHLDSQAAAQKSANIGTNQFNGWACWTVLVKYQASLILIPCTVAETQVKLHFK